MIDWWAEPLQSIHVCNRHVGHEGAMIIDTRRAFKCQRERVKEKEAAVLIEDVIRSCHPPGCINHTDALRRYTGGYVGSNAGIDDNVRIDPDYPFIVTKLR